MSHAAPTDHPIHDLLQNRWSPRAFSNRPVERETLLSLVEAARWAPSSNNEQPWRFLITLRGQESFQRLLSTLAEPNQVWAQHAPVLLLTIAERSFARNGKPNRHAFHDVGQAIAHLTVEAASRGIFVHQMAGFDPDKARAEFSIPETADPVAVVALGYLGDPAALPEPFRTRETAARARRPLSQSIFADRYGAPADWAQS